MSMVRFAHTHTLRPDPPADDWDAAPEVAPDDVTPARTFDPMGGDLGVCDCAGCGCELIGERTAAHTPKRYWRRLKAVAGRILDRSTGSLRPYCPACLAETERRADRRGQSADAERRLPRVILFEQPAA